MLTVGMVNNESGSGGAGGSSSPQPEDCCAESEAMCRTTARTAAGSERRIGPSSLWENTMEERGRRSSILPRKSGARCYRTNLDPAIGLPAARRGVRGERDGRAVAAGYDLLVTRPLDHQIVAHRFRLQRGDAKVVVGRSAV